MSVEDKINVWLHSPWMVWVAIITIVVGAVCLIIAEFRSDQPTNSP